MTRPRNLLDYDIDIWVFVTRIVYLNIKLLMTIPHDDQFECVMLDADLFTEYAEFNGVTL